PPPIAIFHVSLHDALPIWDHHDGVPSGFARRTPRLSMGSKVLGKITSPASGPRGPDVQMNLSVPEDWILTGATLEIELPRNLARSEEHTSELQSLRHLVCR